MDKYTRNIGFAALFAFVGGAILASGAHSYLFLRLHASSTQSIYHEKLNVYSNMKHQIESGNSEFATDFFDEALEALCDDCLAQSTEMFGTPSKHYFMFSKSEKYLATVTETGA